MSFLEIEGVETYYGQSHILQGVDLEVNEGEVVALLGRNGVGKTTTLRSILQLTPPRSGSIRFRDEELVGKDTHEVAGAGIGWIPEGRRMFSRLSVEENIRAAVADSEGVDAALETAYETFPILRERQGQRAGTLSGGQQQMLAIARALVGGPDLLLVDEPSEGVQPSIVQSITEDLKEINEEFDTTILFVEQNLSVIRGLADRCYAIDRGTIVDEITGDAVSDGDNLEEYLVV